MEHHHREQAPPSGPPPSEMTGPSRSAQPAEQGKPAPKKPKEEHEKPPATP
jgi:hypothetical protein